MDVDEDDDAEYYQYEPVFGTDDLRKCSHRTEMEKSLLEEKQKENGHDLLNDDNDHSLTSDVSLGANVVNIVNNISIK